MHIPNTDSVNKTVSRAGAVYYPIPEDKEVGT